MVFTAGFLTFWDVLPRSCDKKAAFKWAAYGDNTGSDPTITAIYWDVNSSILIVGGM